MDKITLKGRSLVNIGDLTRDEVLLVLQRARKLKLSWYDELEGGAGHGRPLLGKTMAMIFQKSSLRTRVTFETGMTQFGGHAIYLEQSIGLGKREPIGDIALNLSRWVQIIIARTFGHDIVDGLAHYARDVHGKPVPVINALSDREHPCQALATMQTLWEHTHGDVPNAVDVPWNQLKMTWVGDGNNVCHSLMMICATLGVNFVAACPKGYWPEPVLVGEAKVRAKGQGSELSIVEDPAEAVLGADAIYTDVWASMGQEEEQKEREKAFRQYTVDAALVALAALEKPNVLVMHCLPAHRDEEVMAEVLDGPFSVTPFAGKHAGSILDEAENRLHVQKALVWEMLDLGETE